MSPRIPKALIIFGYFFLLIIFVITTTVIYQLPPVIPPLIISPTPNKPTANQTPTQIITPLPSQTSFLLTAVGDIMPGRSVNAQLRALNDFTAAFSDTAEILKSSDLTFANLEGPLIPDCPTVNEGMIFCGDPRFVDGLISAGIDIVSLANNHSNNYGPDHLADTAALLKKNGIIPLLDGIPEIIKHHQLTIGLLAQNLTYTSAHNFPNYIPKILAQIQVLKPQVDLIVISLHWGIEYQTNPQPWQQQVAHRLIDAGADLILGHHSHVTQPTETYQNKLILYSMGNFIFDQTEPEATRHSNIYSLKIDSPQTTLEKQTPVIIKDYFRPTLTD